MIFAYDCHWRVSLYAAQFLLFPLHYHMLQTTVLCLSAFIGRINLNWISFFFRLLAFFVGTAVMQWYPYSLGRQGFERFNI